jgi:5'-nucleotidase
MMAAFTKTARRILFLLFLLSLPLLAEKVPITILHVSDIYEITPVAGGKEGGMARLATIHKQLFRQNPRTITILGGDCLSPSALGTAVINGQPIAGAQMVAAMNAVGFDYATFGNHEFDLTEDQFRQRLTESKFRWISSNVSAADGQPFPGVWQNTVLAETGDKGTEVRIGLFGLTVDSNKKPWVRYTDALQAAREQVRQLRPRVEILIAITHLPIEMDRLIAAELPDVDIILGGHEQENYQEWRGTRFTPIFKADSNARSAYILQLTYDTEKHLLYVNPMFRRVTAEFPDDPATAALVNTWVQRGFEAFRASGFDPDQTVAISPIALDGLEASVRNFGTNLTDMIGRAMLRDAPEAELSIFNGGMVRIDDMLPPGPITQYDVLRMLPFGGKTLSVEFKGKLLQRVLDQGLANRGKGGFLQTQNVSRDPKTGAWLIQGNPLDPNRTYRVAMTEYLMTGQEAGLEYLTDKEPGVGVIVPKRDIRFAFIDELQALWPATPNSNTTVPPGK